MQEVPKIVGFVSDTHGLLRETVIQELNGCDLILHAGDFDTPDILKKLQKIAPVVAARGNMDRGDWAEGLQRYDIAQIAGISLCVIHDIYQLDLEPGAAGMTVVVSGHTHQPVITQHKGVWYINPGSAGYRRMGKPLSIAKLTIRAGKLVPQIIRLDE